MSQNLRKVDLNLLNIFAELMKDPNLTNTAKRLNMTQPAVSMALKRLRSLYNDPLFIKNGRIMQATEKAKDLEPIITQALHSIANTLPSNSRFDPLSAKLNFRINSFAYAEQLFAGEFFEQISAQAPKTSLTITSDYFQNPESLLRNRHVDIHLDYQPISHPDFHHHILLQEDIVVVARENHTRLSNKTEITMAEFLNEKHAISSFKDNHKLLEQHFINEMLDQFNTRDVGYHGNSEIGTMSMVSKTDMLTLVPKHILNMLKEHRDYIYFKPPFSCKQFSLYMNWYAGVHHDKGHRWFREFLINNASNIVDGAQ